MAGKEYTAKEGLTEETFLEGSVKKISQKSRDEPELDSRERDEENAALSKRLSDSWYQGKLHSQEKILEVSGIVFMDTERIVSGSQPEINEFYFHYASPL